MTAVAEKPQLLPALKFTFSPRQYTALQHLMQPRLLWEILYGGAKGGGKSAFLVRFAFLYAVEIAREFSLKCTKDLRRIPVVGFLGRKIGVDFNATTLLTWKRDIPADR